MAEKKPKQPSKGEVDARHRRKSDQVEKLRKGIDRLRKKYRKDLDSSDRQDQLTALAVALIDLTYERVGNDNSASENGHFGVTGWLGEHVTVRGDKATFEYVGKSGVEHKKVIEDKKVVSVLKDVLDNRDPDAALFSCENEDVCVKARHVNEYLEEFGVTAKDIRGMHANEEMRSRLQAIRSAGGDLPEDKKEREAKLKAEFAQALEETAERVGHESATLRSQYLVPALEPNFMRDGSVIEKLDQRKSAALLVRVSSLVQRYLRSRVQ